jgi:hypothetical protein
MCLLFSNFFGSGYEVVAVGVEVDWTFVPEHFGES